MERGREVKRGGNCSVSAPRRARTSGGFKDITGAEDDDLMDDVHSSRLRERLKKDSGLFSLKRVISASGISQSRTKRKRQDSQIHVHSSLMDEGDDATDDTDVGLSEEDDDPPPPTIPRWRGKLKLPTRQLDVEGIEVNMLAVPRKARSATVKRHHELSSHNVEVGVSNASPAPPSPRQTSPSNVLSSSSNIAIKKTKQSGSKSRSSKVLKTLDLLSDNEVEVAEALSDFARLMVNQAHPPVPDTCLEMKPNHLKAEQLNAASGMPAPFSESGVTIDGETGISSPLQASRLVIRASPFAVCPVQPELVSGEVTAPKRKRPRVRPRMEDAGYNLQMRALLHARIIETVNAGLPSLSKLSDENVSMAETAVASGSKTRSGNVLLSVSEAPYNTDTSHLMRENEKLSDECQLADVKELVTEDDIAGKLKTSSDEDKQNVEALNLCLENGYLATADFQDKEAVTVENISCVLDGTILCAETRELSKTPPPMPPSTALPPSSGLSPPVDVDINLAASPCAHLGIQNQQPSVVSTPEESAAPDTANVEGATPVKMSWLDKEQQRLKENHLGKLTEISKVQELEPPCNEGTLSGSFCRQKDLKVLNNEDNVNDKAIRLDIDSTPKPCESISMEKAADRSVSENANKLAFSATNNAAVSEACSLAGWAQGLPPVGPVGYYGPAAAAAMVAAAWSGVPSLAGPLMSDEKTASSIQSPPFLMKLPQARKRCSTHVYIAHLIALQQAIARHSLFSNPFGNPSSSYRTSSHTLNPLFPPFEAIINRNAEVFSGSGAPLGNPVASEGLTVIGAERTPEAAALFSLEPCEKEQETALVVDSASRRQSASPQLLSTQLQSATLQAGLPTLFPSSVATAGVGSGHGLGSSTNVVANGNFFNAINRDGLIQQNNLTFSFPPPHLASLAFGGAPYMGGQQAAQLFSNPYYSMHLVHAQPQQAQSFPDIVAGLTQKQSQSQGVRSFSTPGTNQHHQSSPQSQPQSPIKSPQSLPQEESHLEFDDVSGKRGFPTHCRSIEGQQTSSLSSNQSSYPNAFLGTGLQVLSGHIQDFDFMTQFSGKQVTKIPQNKASARSQINNQSSRSPKKQQQSTTLQQHPGAVSTLSMSLKEIEAQASQLFGNMSYRLSTTEGLEALAMSNISRAAVSNLHPYSKASDMKGSKIDDSGSICKASTGPGPLGLAPVAAVMAPQGHTVFQNMTDLARNYAQHQARDQLNGQSSTHSSPQTQPQQQQQQQQQEQRCLQLERAVVRGEDVRMLQDGNNSFGDAVTGKEVFEDRNLALKKAANVASRGDFDTLSNTQGSSQSANGGVSHSASGHCTPTSSSRPLTMASGSASVAQPGNHQLKQAGLRSKIAAASGTAAAQMSSHSFPTYSDRIFAGVSSSKLQVQGSNPGQIIPIQSARQVPCPNMQSKASQKPSLAFSAAGPQPHLLLASAISKAQGQQQLRNLSSSPSKNTISRIPSSISTASVSPPALSHQLSAASKSSGKSAATGKGSGSIPHKSLGGNSGKKSNAISTQISAGQAVQTLPLKSSSHQQQQQQLSPSLQQFPSLPLSAQHHHSYTIAHQSLSHPTQQQQTAKTTLQNRQQFQMRHHASIQQQQLLQSHAQQALLQQSSIQQQSDVASQPQQPPNLYPRVSSHHLLFQQQPQNSQQTTLSHLQSLAAPAATNSDSTSQTLMMGPQAAVHGTGYGRLISDGTSLNQAATARSSPSSNGRSLTNFNQGNAALHRVLGASPSIHPQLGLNGITSIGQSQPTNPLFHAVVGVYPPANANQGISKSSGQKNPSEGSGLDQMNAISVPKPCQSPTVSHQGHDGKQQAADQYSGKAG